MGLYVTAMDSNYIYNYLSTTMNDLHRPIYAPNSPVNTPQSYYYNSSNAGRTKNEEMNPYYEVNSNY